MALMDVVSNFHKDNPSAVVIGLLFFLIVGTSSGGIWISNLKFSLDRQEKLHQRILEFRDEKHREELLFQKRRVEFYKRNSGSIRENFKKISELTLEIESAILESCPELKSSENCQDIRKTIFALKDEGKNGEYSLDAIDNLENFFEISSWQLGPSEIVVSNARANYPALTTAGVGIVCMALLLIFSIRLKSRKSS